ncbi:MAG TPA: putative toxin-antitoxin system toxin component, PIN family [Burkholderiales bacterium]|nr:putative toxin-antitoxin system toxin component, PIN family [Burkholderiales bacterium]
MTPRRVVLDTNIWLDWLVFKDPSIAYLRQAVSEGRAEVVIDAACEAELERVLAYDLAKHTLDPAAQVAALAECRRIARRTDAVAPQAERRLLPRCQDPDDQKFLELALAARAEYLVSKDHKLLELARRTKAFRIVVPRKLALG